VINAGFARCSGMGSGMSAFPEPTRVEDAGRLREVGIRQERLQT